jgi:signal peptidase II
MQAKAGTPLSDEADPALISGDRRPYLALWAGVAGAVLALDQLTKWWAVDNLRPGAPRRVVGHWFEFDLTRNAGAAFSTATGYTVVLTILAIGVVAICVRMAGRLRSTGWAVTLGLVLGGALGNVSDRLFRAPGPFHGHVVDFLRLPHWPVFNLADSSICVAAALFAILSARGVRLDGTSIHRDTGTAEP